MDEDRKREWLDKLVFQVVSYNRMGGEGTIVRCTRSESSR